MQLERQEFHRVLGILDVDIFSGGLNYVFGETYTPGEAGLVSLWRPKPEFYHDKPDNALFLLRAQKEAIHELDLTLGITHCPDQVVLCIFPAPF